MKRPGFYCLTAGILTVLLLSCSIQERTRTEINLLGTTCTVTIYSRNPAPVLDRVFNRLWEIDRTMKYSGDESEVSIVNMTAGGPGVDVEPSTLEVIKRGLYYSKLGNGRFDITIGPLVSLWGIGKDAEGRVPPQDQIQKAVSLIGYDRLHINGSTVTLDDPGMSIDLGGIAKGYAADEVAGILEENGVQYGLINLGGNVLAYGSKPDGSPWRIGVQNPNNPRGSFLGVLSVTGKAVVTSGPYERFFIQDGKRYHHILDTATGYPVENGVMSATIVAVQSIDADGLSTLVFSLGPEKGISLINTLDGVEALVITAEGKLYTSSGIKDYFTLTDDTFRFVP